MTDASRRSPDLSAPDLSAPDLTASDLPRVGLRDPFGFPVYSRGERLADAAVHGLGVTAGLAGALWLTLATWAGTTTLEHACLIVYGLGLLATLVISALYNMAPPGPAKEWFRRMDHAAIYVAIAGTYTPFAMLRLDAPLGPLLCAAVWTGALVGIVLKLVAPRRFERVGLALYLALGWAVLPAAEPWLAAMSLPTLWLIGIGGLLYTGGVVFHLLERLPFHNALWHTAVLAAAACHFAAVATEFSDLVG